VHGHYSEYKFHSKKGGKFLGNVLSIYGIALIFCY
jgi:hypothetical protein